MPQLTDRKNRAQSVTLDVSNRPLGDVLRALAAQAKFKLVYDADNPVFKKRITFKVAKSDINLALSKALEGSGLVATMTSDGETIVIRPGTSVPSRVNSQGPETGTIAGRVSDSTTGEAVAGATVTIEGRKLAATTDEKGQFSIRDVPVGTQQLSVRLVGYKVWRSAVEVNTNKTARVTIVLTTSSTMLSEIVTTASGKQRRLEVGNDITVINVDSVIRTAPINNVTDLLEHRVPGLTVQRAGGGPGDPSLIRIRGTGSISRSNEPIVIVDGIRIYSDETTNRDMGDLGSPTADGGGMNRIGTTRSAASQLDQIDPNSIATIEVQKGAAASALYGADAANGAIIITTKRGRPGKAKWNVTADRGTKQLVGKYPNNYCYYGYGIEGYRSGQEGSCTFSSKTSIERVTNFQTLNDSRYTVLDRGIDSRVSVNVGGGVNAFTYSVTGTLTHATGYLRLPQVEIDRFEAEHDRPVPEWAISPELFSTGILSSNLMFQPNERVHVGLSQSLSRSRQQKSTLERALNYLQGVSIDTTRLGVHGIFDRTPYIRTRIRNLTSRTAINSEWQATSWLPVTAVVGLDLINRNDERALLRGIDQDKPEGGFSGGTANTMMQSFSLGLGRGGITLPGRGLRAIRVLSGVNAVRMSTASYRSYADSIPLGVYVPATLNGGSQTRLSNVTAGWYVEPKLDIQSKYFVIPGIRFDGSNTSGSRGGLASFPRLSFAWITSDESFWPRGTGVDLLRLRTALGYGGRLPSAGDHLRLLEYRLASIGGIEQEVLGFRAIGNTKLVPERVREIEVGFDAELWKNRANLSVTYVHKITDNSIVTMPVAPSVIGREITIPVNLGQVRNQSFETVLTASFIERRSMGFVVTTSFSRQSDIIARLKFQVPSGLENIRYVEGYPVGSIWYRPMTTYSDLNGNGVIDDKGEFRISDSAVFAGSSDPRYQLSMLPTLTVLSGQVTVSAVLAYRDGEVRPAGGRLGCLSCSADDPRKSPIAEQAFITSAAPQVVNVLEFSSMSVSARLPKSFVRRLSVNEASISVQGRNLGTKTNSALKDPGVGAMKVNMIGLEGVPRPREWRLNVRIGA